MTLFLILPTKLWLFLQPGVTVGLNHWTNLRCGQWFWDLEPGYANPHISFSWALVCIFAPNEDCGFGHLFLTFWFRYESIILQPVWREEKITVTDNFLYWKRDICIACKCYPLNGSASDWSFLSQSPQLVPSVFWGGDGEQPSCFHASLPVCGEHFMLPSIPNLG